MYRNNRQTGFLILEAIIALALFSLCIFSTISLSFGARRIFDNARERSLLLNKLSPILADQAVFNVLAVHEEYGNDASIVTLSSSTELGRSIDFRLLEPDIFSAYGKDTCPAVLDFSKSASAVSGAALPIASPNTITSMTVKGATTYISTDSNVSSDPDLFVFDMDDLSNPRLISSLNTGPGLAGLTVAGPFIYAADSSSLNQLQIIDIHDRSHPFLLAQAKVPLDDASSTRPYASAIFYDKGFVYLGTEKGNNPEFTVWNVVDPAHPALAGRYETGTKVEKIFVKGNRAYVAGTETNQVMFFDVSDPAQPVLKSISTPFGWQTEVGMALDVFEDSLALGRSTGGMNVATNPEFIGYTASTSAQSSSFDEPGGIYGIVTRPPNFVILTRRVTGQLRIDSATGTTKSFYDIPGIPAALSCDGGNLYVASNNSPSITLVKDFHE